MQHHLSVSPMSHEHAMPSDMTVLYVRRMQWDSQGKEASGVGKGSGEVIPLGAGGSGMLQGKPERQHRLGQRNWRGWSLHGGDKGAETCAHPLVDRDAVVAQHGQR